MQVSDEERNKNMYYKCNIIEYKKSKSLRDLKKII